MGVLEISDALLDQLHGIAANNNSSVDTLLTDYVAEYKNSQAVSTTRSYSYDALLLYKLVFEKSKDAILITDDDAHYVEANPAACALLGYRREELLQLSVWDITPLPGQPKAQDLWQTFVAQGQQADTYTVQHRDGTLIEVDYSAITNILPGLNMAALRDTTRRRQAEAALKGSEERYRLLVENAGVGIGYYDLDGTILFMNPTGLEYVGDTLENVLGKSAVEIFGADMGNLILARAQNIIEHQNLATFEDFVQLPTTSSWFLSTYSVTRNDSGEAMGIQVISHDITKQKETEQSLSDAIAREREQRSLAQSLRTTAEALVSAAELDQTLPFVFQELQRVVPHDCILVCTVEKDHLNILTQHGWAHQPVEVSSSYSEHPILHKALTEGQTLTVQDILPTYKYIPGFDSHLVGWLGIPLVSRDVTVGFLSIGLRSREFTKKDREILGAFGNQLALAIDNYRIIEDLEASLLGLKHAQQNLLQAARLAAIGELAVGVAHQVNNPLTTIIADSHLLLEQLPPDGKAHESAEAISQAAHRAGEVVQRLLDFSRTKPSELTALDINDGLHQAMALVRSQIDPDYARLWVDLEPGLPPINGSEDHLQDVWINLLLNARDAVAERNNGEIKIISSRASDGKHVTINIQDNGTGIESGDRNRIFDPFFTTKKQGTGLGLAVCQDIIKHHGGSISVHSQPGEWTVFIVTLPVMPEAEGQDTNGENPGN